jgi:hypothetical protein
VDDHGNPERFAHSRTLKVVLQLNQNVRREIAGGQVAAREQRKLIDFLRRKLGWSIWRY